MAAPRVPAMTGEDRTTPRPDLADAARKLLASASQGNIEQVHEVVIRDIDPYEDAPRVLHLIPLGGVLGVAITAANEYPADEDILFVSMAAVGNAMPTLGFTARPTAAYVIAPRAALEGAPHDQ